MTPRQPNRDDEVCLCFHVTHGKVAQFVRVTQPRVASQLSECFGAGSGCGWCRPFLQRIFDAQRAGSPSEPLPSPDEYAAARKRYREQAKLTSESKSKRDPTDG